MAYTPEERQTAIETVVAGLREGIPLSVICCADNMPCDDTIRSWADGDETFSRLIARARETGFDKIALDALRISDTPVQGVIITEKADGTKDVKTEDMLGHRKLQVETRLKLLAKWDPKRYGELIKHGNADGSNLDMSDRVTAARERAMRGD